LKLNCLKPCTTIKKIVQNIKTIQLNLFSTLQIVIHHSWSNCVPDDQERETQLKKKQ